MSSLRPYLAAVRATLTAALAVENFPSQVRQGCWTGCAALTGRARPVLRGRI